MQRREKMFEMASIKSRIGVDMDNTWRNIFRDFVECYESIEILASNCILVGEDCENARENLLASIIDAMRKEIGE